MGGRRHITAGKEFSATLQATEWIGELFQSAVIGQIISNEWITDSPAQHVGRQQLYHRSALDLLLVTVC